jgi:hypothetical protein
MSKQAEGVSDSALQELRYNPMDRFLIVIESLQGKNNVAVFASVFPKTRNYGNMMEYGPDYITNQYL